MAEDLEYSYVQAMKDSLVRACGEYRYKNGAFATAVTKTTSIIDDLNIIINSPLLATNEKKVFEQIKNIVISVRNMEAHGEKLDMLRISMEPIMAFDKVVSADMKLRGQYKPPTLAQIQGENGTVKETILIDDDGKVTCYKGGQPGVIPGAPQAFNEAQQKAQRTLVKDPDADTHVMAYAEVGTDTEYKRVKVSSSKPEGASPGPSAEKFKTEQPELRKATGFAGFGKAFEGNVKNAFL